MTSKPKTALVVAIKARAKGNMGEQDIRTDNKAMRYSPTKCRELRGGRGVGNVKHVVER